MFLDYAEEMITSLFEAYRASPKTLKMSIDDLKQNIPGPLSSFYEAVVDKEAFVSFYVSR